MTVLNKIGPNADDFRAALQARFAEATGRGEPYIEINSGQLNRAVGDYPKANRMPKLCRVMRDERLGCDAIVSDTGAGYDGPRLTIRYHIPR